MIVEELLSKLNHVKVILILVFLVFTELLQLMQLALHTLLPPLHTFGVLHHTIVSAVGPRL